MALFAWMLFRGVIQWAALTKAAALILPFMAAAWLGARLFRRSGKAAYRRVALGVLVLAGLYEVFRF
ncbi:MAG: hypothetical protein VW268_11155 [Rhodospirillaceae bacterium]